MISYFMNVLSKYNKKNTGDKNMNINFVGARKDEMNLFIIYKNMPSTQNGLLFTSS